MILLALWNALGGGRLSNKADGWWPHRGITRACRHQPALSVEVLESRTLLSFMRVSYAVGQQPVSVAVGDFNHDGHADLVTANRESNDVSVLLGNDDGTFQLPAINTDILGSPSSVAVGDFDGDGFHDDLAVAYGGTNSIAVWLGTGDGHFQFSGEYLVGANPVAIVVGHFHDPKISDLAVVNYDSDTVSILLGNGDGSFQEAKTISVDRGPIALAVGHFHDPNISDLAVAHLYSDRLGDYGGVTVLVGDGHGMFEARWTYSPIGGTTSVVVGDFNGDGNDDIAMTTGVCCNRKLSGLVVPPRVEVLLGNGDGTFTPGIASDPIRSDRSALAAADFNRDDRLDLVVANTGSFGSPDHTVTVLLGNGNGTFRFDNDYDTGMAPSSVAAGDFNRDGFPDLAVADGGDDTVSVLLNAADWSRRPNRVRGLGWVTATIPAKTFSQPAEATTTVVIGQSKTVWPRSDAPARTGPFVGGVEEKSNAVFARLRTHGHDRVDEWWSAWAE